MDAFDLAVMSRTIMSVEHCQRQRRRSQNVASRDEPSICGFGSYAE